jgi:3-oxoacyl-[acyl-carrier protein] reductase
MSQHPLPQIPAAQPGCALVTGGSRGIGRAVAIRLATDGFNVAFCYRSDGPAAREVASIIEKAGSSVYHGVCDVADFHAVSAFTEKAEAELGPVRALVNSAGIVRDNPMALMPVPDWSAVIDTNLTGTFNFCRATIFGLMKRRSGVIVNMSSVAGVSGHASQTNYSAAKAGVIGMSKALAREVARHNIRVNVVAPGFIETDMTSGLSDKTREGALRQIGMHRFGTPESIAEITSFLVSDRAEYITGQTIQVDGGLVL